MIFHTLLAYFLFGGTSVLLLTLMAFGVSRLARTKASVWFSRFLWALMVWAAADVLELVGPSEEWSKFWYGTLRTTAVCLSAICWIRFCTDYCRFERSWLLKSLQILLSLFGGVLVALAWTPGRALLFQDLVFQRKEWLWEPVSRELGPLFDVYFGFGVSCSLIGLGMLAVHIFRTGPYSRWQVITVAAATGLTSAFAILTGAGRLGVPMLDKTVFALPVMVMALLVSLTRLGFLRASPMFLNALVNSIPDGILALDKRRFLVEANDAGLQLTESKNAESLFRPIESAFLAESKLGRLASELRTGRHEVVVQDSARRRVYCIDVVDIADKGSTHGKLMIFRDETLLRQSMEDLSAYSYRVAHDLKNPLSAIMNYAEMIPMQDIGLSQDEICDGIADTVDSMNDIIRELLLLATIRDGDAQEFVSVDVLKTAEKIVERVSRNKVELLIDDAEQWKPALGRAAWVEEILTNLVSNAIEHGGASGLTVSLSCTDKGKYVEYSVIDDGCGVDDDQIEQLFRKPEQVGADGKAGQPRGFGLSIARRLAEKQGGTLGYRSTSGKGATFWFTLRATCG